MGCSRWIRKAGIFAKVVKISLGLRKFHNHSENFAILEKLENFARLAKFRYPFDSCHGRVSGINKICFLCSSYCRSQATAA